MKKLIVGIIIGLVLALTINIVGASISSSGVMYNSKTLNTVLDDLYSKIEEINNTGDASSSNILIGKTALVKGTKLTGSMANKAGTTTTATKVTESGSNALITIPTNGYYSTSSKISVPIETIKNNISSNLGFDQFISWYDGVSGWILSENNFTVANNGDWILFDSSRRVHFVACKKSQKKTINFTVPDNSYNNCWIEVSNDGTTWTTILKELISRTSVGNYNHNGEYSYTIPEEYSNYTYIRLKSKWDDSEYKLWYTATVTIE